MYLHRVAALVLILLLFACQNDAEKLIFTDDVESGSCSAVHQDELLQTIEVSVEFDSLSSHSPINMATVKIRNLSLDKGLNLMSLEFLEQAQETKKWYSGNLDYVEESKKREKERLALLAAYDEDDVPQGQTGPSGQFGHPRSYTAFLRPKEEMDFRVPLRTDNNLCVALDFQEIDTVDFSSRLYIEHIPYLKSDLAKDYSKRIKSAMLHHWKADSTYRRTIELSANENEQGLPNYSNSQPKIPKRIKKNFTRKLKKSSIIYSKNQFCAQVKENLYAVYDQDEAAIVSIDQGYIFSDYKIFSNIEPMAVEYLLSKMSRHNKIAIYLKEEHFNELASLGYRESTFSTKARGTITKKVKNQLKISEFVLVMRRANEEGLRLALKEDIRSTEKHLVFEKK